MSPAVTAVPSVPPPPTPAAVTQAPTPTAPQDTFGSILARATGTAAANAAAPITLPEAAPPTDATVVAATAAAGNFVVGSGIVLSSTGSPVSLPTAEPPTSQGQPASPPPALGTTLSRAEQLQLRQSVSPQSLPQAVSRRTTPATQTSEQSPTRASTDTTQNPTPVPIPAAIPTPAAVAALPVPATGLPEGRSPVVLGQAPFISDHTTAPPSLATTTTGTPPVPVTATVATSALPDVLVGDRPSMAGERFAAIASAGARLTNQNPTTPSGAFAGVLSTVHSPTNLAASPLIAAAGPSVQPTPGLTTVGATQIPSLTAVADSSRISGSATASAGVLTNLPVSQAPTASAASRSGNPTPAATGLMGAATGTPVTPAAVPASAGVISTSTVRTVGPIPTNPQPNASGQAAAIQPTPGQTTVGATQIPSPTTVAGSTRISGSTMESAGMLTNLPASQAPATPSPVGLRGSTTPTAIGMVGPAPGSAVPPAAVPASAGVIAASTARAAGPTPTSLEAAVSGQTAVVQPTPGQTTVGATQTPAPLAATVVQPTPGQTTVGATQIPSPTMIVDSPRTSGSTTASAAGLTTLPVSQSPATSPPVGLRGTTTPTANGMVGPAAGPAVTPAAVQATTGVISTSTARAEGPTPSNLESPLSGQPTLSPTAVISGTTTVSESGLGFADLLRERYAEASGAMTSSANSTSAGGTAFSGPVGFATSTVGSVAATTPSQATSSTPAAQIAEGVLAHSGAATQNGTTEFRLRLDPPDLGPVQVHLTSDGSSIRGEVVVSNDSVRGMIESQLPELRQRLEAAGVTVQQFNVSTDTGGGGRGSPPQQSEPDPRFATDTVAPIRTPPPQTPGRQSAGRLDVTV